jgi:hypothetical protein
VHANTVTSAVLGTAHVLMCEDNMALVLDGRILNGRAIIVQIETTHAFMHVHYMLSRSRFMSLFANVEV